MNPLMNETLAREKVQRHEKEMAALLRLKQIDSLRKNRFSFLSFMKKLISKAGSRISRKPDFEGIPGVYHLGDSIQR